jgi:hypothetical protein
VRLGGFAVGVRALDGFADAGDLLDLALPFEVAQAVRRERHDVPLEPGDRRAPGAVASDRAEHAHDRLEDRRPVCLGDRRGDVSCGPIRDFARHEP